MGTSLALMNNHVSNGSSLVSSEDDMTSKYYSSRELKVEILPRKYM